MRIITLTAATLLLSITTTLAGATVTLAWDPLNPRSIVGYRIHSGTHPGVYSQVMEAGLTTSAQVSNLASGTTYYFVVTAYNRGGHESKPSNEISYKVPRTDAPPRPSAEEAPEPPGPAATPTPEPRKRPSPLDRKERKRKPLPFPED